MAWRVPPSVAQEEPAQQWRSVVLHWTLLGSIVGTILIVVGTVAAQNYGPAFRVYLIVLGLALTSYALHRRGFRSAASAIASYGFFATASVQVALSGGDHVSATADYVVVILLAGFFRGPSTAIGIAALAGLSLSAIRWAVHRGLYAPAPDYGRGAAVVIESLVIFGVAAIVVVLALRSIESAFAVIRERSARALQLESQLEDARRLEAIGRLAAGVAHDFNNVLTIILGNAHFLHSTPEMPEDAKASLEDISLAVEAAQRLTSQLMALGRKRGRLPRVIDLVDTVRASSRLIRQLVPTSVAIDFLLRDDKHFSIHVAIDPAEIDQIVVNLVANARDAMPSGGQLSIKVDRIALSEHVKLPPGDYACIEVRDTGAGMDEHTLAHAFDMFFSTTGYERGTGLGLATVHAIAEDHGGFVAIESAKGAGTTIRVLLPCTTSGASVVEQRATPHPSQARRHAGSTILLVEDDEPVRRVASHALEDAGFVVSIATHAQEAIERCEAPDFQPALVVSDIVMPGMNGVELRHVLAKLRNSLPVLLVSGCVEPSRTAEFSAPAAFLRKPYVPEQLIESVNILLDKVQHASEFDES
jgi:signal transduction histidine kinase